MAEIERATGADLLQFVKDEIDAFFEFGILANGFLRPRCGDCGHDKLVVFSSKRRGFCPSCGVRRMAQTAVHMVYHFIPHVPVSQSVRSPPIPLRLLLAAQPTLVAPVRQVLHRAITRSLLKQAGVKAGNAQSGAATLIHPSVRQPISTLTCTAWCWTACTGAAQTASRNSSKCRLWTAGGGFVVA